MRIRNTCFLLKLCCLWCESLHRMQIKCRTELEFDFLLIGIKLSFCKQKASHKYSVCMRCFCFMLLEFCILNLYYIRFGTFNGTSKSRMSVKLTFLISVWRSVLLKLFRDQVRSWVRVYSRRDMWLLWECLPPSHPPRPAEDSSRGRCSSQSTYI